MPTYNRRSKRILDFQHMAENFATRLEEYKQMSKAEILEGIRTLPKEEVFVYFLCKLVNNSKFKYISGQLS
jgi:hypothetical protein